MTDRVNQIYLAVSDLFPDAHCELNYSNPLELLISIMLSAQTTDNAVNKVTVHLFGKYRTLEDYINAPVEDVENVIRHLGLYKNKAKNIKLMALMMKETYHGVFPSKLEELVLLPGVGRKTANVFLAEYYHVPRIAVDTHVERVSVRLGLAKATDSVLKIEEKLMKKFPKDLWIEMHHKLIFFGRYFCKAQKPMCDKCPLVSICKTPFPN
ncbi:MAG: endonuclease III [Candidatus Izemoplasmatales bacterium]